MDDKSRLPDGSIPSGEVGKLDPTEVLKVGKVHRTRVERKKDDSVQGERERDRRVDNEPDLRRD